MYTDIFLTHNLRSNNFTYKNVHCASTIVYAFVSLARIKKLTADLFRWRRHCVITETNFISPSVRSDRPENKLVKKRKINFPAIKNCFQVTLQ